MVCEDVCCSVFSTVYELFGIHYRFFLIISGNGSNQRVSAFSIPITAIQHCLWESLRLYSQFTHARRNILREALALDQQFLCKGVLGLDFSS